MSSISNLQFVQIANFPNYIVYNDGFVKNIKSGRTLKAYLRKSDGYYIYNLWSNGKTKAFKRSRLVALHFIPNPNKLSDVDHRDCNRTNDLVSNLRWLTSLDNSHNKIETSDTGVKWYKASNKWQAYICLNYKQIHLGYFDIKQDAVDARRKAKLLYHKI